ncbi:MAG: NOB1 family endonuclease [Thermoplasmatota archaeon]
MFLVLDASAFLSGRLNSIPPGFDGVCTTSKVFGEVTKGAPGRLLSNLLEAGLEIRDPASLEKARKAATRTGDLEDLSRTDLSIIALAIELDDPRVVTDDFRVQNVLKGLGISFVEGGEIGNRTIVREWTWTYRCRGCGRFFDSRQKRDECPVCGSGVRKVRKR